MQKSPPLPNIRSRDDRPMACRGTTLVDGPSQAASAPRRRRAAGLLQSDRARPCAAGDRITAVSRTEPIPARPYAPHRRQSLRSRASSNAGFGCVAPTRSSLAVRRRRGLRPASRHNTLLLLLIAFGTDQYGIVVHYILPHRVCQHLEQPEQPFTISRVTAQAPPLPAPCSRSYA